eukprot:9106226-Pyramimonas_sp.AAC.1
MRHQAFNMPSTLSQLSPSSKFILRAEQRPRGMSERGKARLGQEADAGRGCSGGPPRTLNPRAASGGRELQIGGAVLALST